MLEESKWTKEYIREYDHQRYLANKRRLDMREWVNEIKSKLKCCKCPESEVICLDFHHLDPLEKDINIGDALGRGRSKENILKEIEKCVVLCSNCHRKVHAGIISV